MKKRFICVFFLIGCLLKGEIIFADSKEEMSSTLPKNVENNRKKLSSLKEKLSLTNEKTEEMIKVDNTSQNTQTIDSHTKNINSLAVEKKSLENRIEKIIKARMSTNTTVQKYDVAVTKMGKAIRPISGDIVVGFGQRKAGGSISNGIEIRSMMGAKVRASQGGKVIYADKFQGLNNVVMIDYGYNTIGVYGNLISIGVSLNQVVQQGQDIGILGMNKEGQPNLYYEVRFKMKPVNPVNTF